MVRIRTSLSMEGELEPHPYRSPLKAPITTLPSTSTLAYTHIQTDTHICIYMLTITFLSIVAIFELASLCLIDWEK